LTATDAAADRSRAFYRVTAPKTVLVLYEAQRGPEPKAESADDDDDELAYA